MGLVLLQFFHSSFLLGLALLFPTWLFFLRVYLVLLSSLLLTLGILFSYLHHLDNNTWSYLLWRDRALYSQPSFLSKAWVLCDFCSDYI